VRTPAPVITLLTDYGLDDEFVGVCHGVISLICPQARVIDLTHGIERHDILAGALILADSLRFMPVGVHVAVVDPGVGSPRRAVALALKDGRSLVGPDNGLLWPAAQAGGGVIEAVEISASPLALDAVSATFHGRDIFAPVAAHLAAGVALGDAGVRLDPDRLVGLQLPRSRIEHGVLVTEVTLVDRFGNAQLAATREDCETLGLSFGDAVEVGLVVEAGLVSSEIRPGSSEMRPGSSEMRPGSSEMRPGSSEIHPGSSEIHRVRWVRSFADAAQDELLLYEDASRRLAIAVNRASGADRLGLRAGREVRISAASELHSLGPS
jgi:S-adenosylmethionine hydrolase